MLNARQQSNVAIERAYLNAHDERCDFPRIYEDTINSEAADKRIEAYESEMTSYIEIKIFSSPLNEIPHTKNTVTAKIFFDLKIGENNGIIRYRTRFVVREFTQKYGVDFEETFAPTIRLDALRIILTIAAKENWDSY